MNEQQKDFEVKECDCRVVIPAKATITFADKTMVIPFDFRDFIVNNKVEKFIEVFMDYLESEKDDTASFKARNVLVSNKTTDRANNCYPYSVREAYKTTIMEYNNHCYNNGETDFNMNVEINKPALISFISVYDPILSECIKKSLNWDGVVNASLVKKAYKKLTRKRYTQG